LWTEVAHGRMYNAEATSYSCACGRVQVCGLDRMRATYTSGRRSLSVLSRQTDPNRYR